MLAPCKVIRCIRFVTEFLGEKKLLHVWFCEGRVYCFLFSFSNSVPLHCVVHDSIKVLRISKYDLELSQSALLGKLTFGVAKGVMLHYQAFTREVWGLSILMPRFRPIAP
jgi:hypothetical protein